ncbi:MULTISPECIES: replication initiation negative regulator SeqA [Raoultella]|jgi:negative modulator of initiation of replication|uniref:Negative modulator of initiation of replication n=1 Tax=Raoultella planticola TaxID=575 RepID=A0A443VQX3_RAOPL|nr:MULTISPECIES: replication initiation negative regulator SeqA [Raoultella]ATM06559.1 replication initiation negative regulator SeqA [Raoultella planticola]ATM16234.1 replication initiation negative regulator SeqA [Raoultella planticola]AUU05251.1 replication initiation negative regulator SeqA [Raoultella planticola]AUV54560.1 replication initiation regulator SeqA [Raoultella planticola]EIY2677498.1 replication initiation negative regulator SeqA [Raoultella planticola]
MKTIEVDDDLYRYIASHTQHIGESASDILRRMLKFSAVSQTAAPAVKTAPAPAATPAVEAKPVNPAKDKVRAMRELLLSDEYAEQKRAVNRFMLVLTTLYSLDNKAFAEATESLHGRTRVYFAEDSRILLKSGNQTKPKQVPGTPWWVITNTNTGRKCSMIEHIMQSMQFPAELIEKVCGTI